MKKKVEEIKRCRDLIEYAVQSDRDDRTDIRDSNINTIMQKVVSLEEVQTDKI